MKMRLTTNGETVTTTLIKRNNGHGEQIKVIYSDKSEGWEHIEDLQEIQHGGKRKGSGRKPADYETTTVSFRVKTDYVEPVKTAVKQTIAKLDKLAKKK